jgi:hypothetical protein
VFKDEFSNKCWDNYDLLTEEINSTIKGLQENLISEWHYECGFYDIEKALSSGGLEGGVTNSKPKLFIDPSCYERNPIADKSVLIWGDSHAQALSPGIRSYIPFNWQVLQIASSGCAASISVESPSNNNQCDQNNYFTLKTIKKVIPNVVVIAQLSGHSIDKMNKISDRLSTIEVDRVIFIGPVPQWKDDLPKITARNLWILRPHYTTIGLDKDVLEKNKILRSFRKDQAEYVEAIGYFCDLRGCLIYTGEDIKKTITTFDYGHLTPHASYYFGRDILTPRIVSE